MDTVIFPTAKPETEAEFKTVIDRLQIEMQHLVLRMDEREERIEQLHVRNQARINDILKQLRHVQTDR